MTIKDKSEIEDRGLEIDLTGPDGNAFSLLGVASKLSRDMDLDAEAVLDEMRAGDYDLLVEVFEKHFGNVVTLYR